MTVKVNDTLVDAMCIEQRRVATNQFALRIALAKSYKQLAGMAHVCVTETGLRMLDHRLAYVNDEGNMVIFYGLFPNIKGGLHE